MLEIVDSEIKIFPMLKNIIFLVATKYNHGKTKVNLSYHNIRLNRKRNTLAVMIK